MLYMMQVNEDDPIDDTQWRETCTSKYAAEVHLAEV